MRRVLAAVALATVLSGGAAKAGEAVPPYKTMRAMQALEDRIAGGDALAQAARAKAIPRLGQGFAAMPAETWRDLRNARALVAYLFGGGDAVTIARAIQPEALHKDAATLYRGALAYAGGDDDGARGLLLPIEAKTLPSGLAGHLALIQATLVEPTDKAKALALLDLTRLLEPGTLVEEAALRKEMSLIGDSGDFDKLSLLGATLPGGVRPLDLRRELPAARRRAGGAGRAGQRAHSATTGSCGSWRRCRARTGAASISRSRAGKPWRGISCRRRSPPPKAAGSPRRARATRRARNSTTAPPRSWARQLRQGVDRARRHNARPPGGARPDPAHRRARHGRDDARRRVGRRQRAGRRKRAADEGRGEPERRRSQPAKREEMKLSVLASLVPGAGTQSSARSPIEGSAGRDFGALLGGMAKDTPTGTLPCCSLSGVPPVAEPTALREGVRCGCARAGQRRRGGDRLATEIVLICRAESRSCPTCRWPRRHQSPVSEAPPARPA